MASGGYTFAQGLLYAAAGAGAIFGAIYLASRKSVRGLGRLIAIAPMLTGAGLILFANSTVMALALPVMAVVGFGQMTHMASSNTLLQTIVDEDKRGRVMSFYALAFLGTQPFGNLAFGALAQHIGAH